MVLITRSPANEMLDTPVQSPTPPAFGFAPPIADEAVTEPLLDLFDFSSEDAEKLLLSLQQNIPDISKLFDGSIGSFTWS